jgi:hypothetical protein
LLLSGEMCQTIRKILCERSEYFSFGASHRTATTTRGQHAFAQDRSDA